MSDAWAMWYNRTVVHFVRIIRNKDMFEKTLDNRDGDDVALLLDIKPDPVMLHELELQLQQEVMPTPVERMGGERIATAYSAIKRLVDAAVAEAEARWSGMRFSIRGREPTLEERRAEILKMVKENKSFGRLLMQLVGDRCDGKASVCYKNAGVSRQVYSRIISDPMTRVSRRTVFQLCVGLRLTREESENFIKAAGYAFGGTDMESQVFAYCLSNKILSLFDINDLLVLCGCEPIDIA